VKLREIESWGVKLRESEVQGGISKWVVVQGGLVKFPRRAANDPSRAELRQNRIGSLL
jgi:hypothetical protein